MPLKLNMNMKPCFFTLNNEHILAKHSLAMRTKKYTKISNKNIICTVSQNHKKVQALLLMHSLQREQNNIPTYLIKTVVLQSLKI